VLNFEELPKKYSLVNINITDLEQNIERAFKVHNGQKNITQSKPSIEIQSPEAEKMVFQLTETKVVDDDVAHLYTSKTFKGHLIGRPQVHLRMSMSSHGLNLFVFDGSNSFSIEPVTPENNTTHVVFYKKDLQFEGIKCHINDAELDPQRNIQGFGSLRNPMHKRIYRLAMIANNTYRNQFGGNPYNPQNVLDHFVVGINLLNGVYERDLGVSFVLVSNFECANAILNDHTNTNQVHQFITGILGTPGFDVGHSMLWSNTGGAARLGSVCDSNLKGRGFSGSARSVSTLYIDYCAHELGHQFNANHTFVSQQCGTSVNNNRYEVGEGSTIIAYAGVCSNGYQIFSDPYFHARSLIEIHGFMGNTSLGGSCGTALFTGNESAPFANANADITIPKETPFVLVADGFDADGDPIDFVWQ
jgi:hypothetical protein